MVRGLAGAIAGPGFDRIGGGIEQLGEPRFLAPPELAQDMVDGVLAGLADAHPQPAELLVAQLVDQHLDQRGMLASEHLAHRQTRLVHEGQRFDQNEIEAAIPALHDGRGIASPALPAPAGAVGQPVEDHPADVVACLLVLGSGVPQANDDLHRCSSMGRHALARHAKLALVRLRRACVDGIRRGGRCRSEVRARIRYAFGRLTRSEQ